MPTPTRAATEKAADVFRDTQLKIDALKDVVKANTAAKKILIAFMDSKGTTIFQPAHPKGGVELKTVLVDGLDMDALRTYLGDKISKFQLKRVRHHLSVRNRGT